MNPLVTICIPTYNASSTLEETLESLSNQTYKNFKVKVFDNCSTDNTLEIAKKFPQIEILESSNNIGAEGNFTRCLQGGEGKYTAVYHSDDLYYPTMIEEQVKYLEKTKSLAVFTHANRIDSKGKVLGERLLPKELKRVSRVLSFEEFSSLIFKYANFITCPSAMARTEVFKNDIKVWNGSKYGTSADLDVWFRLASLGSVGFIPRPLMGYREAEASYSYRIAKVRVERHRIFKVLDEKMKELKREDLQSYYEFLNFKDEVYRSLNIIRSNNIDVDFPKISGDFVNIIRCSTESKWHFKIFIAGIVVLAIRPFFSKTIRRKLKKASIS